MHRPPPRRAPGSAALLPLLLAGAGALLLHPPGLLAQPGASGIQGPALLTGEGPPSVRALALAGAFPLQDRDADLLFGNPAGVERARGVSLALFQEGTQLRVSAMAAGTAWFGGGAALGLRQMEWGTAGNRDRAAVATAGYGRVVRGVRVGAALSGAELRGGGGQGNAGWIDLGALVDVGPVSVGVSGGGVGTEVDLEGWDDDLPLWGRVGLGSRAAPVGPLDLAGYGHLTVREGRRPETGAGVEVGWWPRVGRTLVARAGVGSSPRPQASRLTAGAAFLGDALTLEYAWRRIEGGDDLHAVALRFR